MTHIDVLLENDTLVVLGPPSIVNLQLDTGATGVRGSLTYVGSGLPSALTIPNYSSILPGDLYINTQPGQNYSWLYQYQVMPGGNAWQPILSTTPVLYKAIYTQTFTAGDTTITIPLSTITSSVATYTADNFHVNFDIEDTVPVAAAIKTKTYSASTLTLVLTAARWSGGTWSAIATSGVKVNLSVSLVV